MHPVNARVPAVTLMPALTVSGVLLLVWLVRNSEGMQSDWPAIPGTKASASSV